jgi:hypothetical protein
MQGRTHGRNLVTIASARRAFVRTAATPAFATTVVGSQN